MTERTLHHRKRLAQSVTVAAIGFALIAGSGTMTGWKASEQITSQERTIQAGELSLDRAASSGSWTLNGVPIPAEDLASVRIVPGDQVAYTGSSTPRVVGDTLVGWMYFTGVDAVAGTLAGTPAASLSWSVGGAQEPKKLTEADHLIPQPVAFSVTMAPIGDPTYLSGSEGQALSLDLSDIQVAVSMIKPAGSTPGGGAPELEDPEEATNYWPISDEGLRQAVKRELGIDREPTLDDAPLLESLDASGDPSITFTHGLEHATNLTRLDLSGTSVERVSALEAVPGAFSKLTHLSLAGTPTLGGFVDVTGLPALVSLDLSDTPLTDTGSISLDNPGLLTHLDLSGTQVSDISNLEYWLHNLAWLDISRTQISDISRLAGMQDLTHLDASDTQVSDISALEYFWSLTYLDLRGTQVSDISALANMHDLAHLDLSGTHVSDISALTSMGYLAHLDLSGTQVSDISALEHSWSLTYLDLSGTQVTDWAPASHIENVGGRP